MKSLVFNQYSIVLVGEIIVNFVLLICVYIINKRESLMVKNNLLLRFSLLFISLITITSLFYVTPLIQGYVLDFALLLEMNIECYYLYLILFQLQFLDEFQIISISKKKRYNLFIISVVVIISLILNIYLDNIFIKNHILTIFLMSIIVYLYIKIFIYIKVESYKPILRGLRDNKVGISFFILSTILFNYLLSLFYVNNNLIVGLFLLISILFTIFLTCYMSIFKRVPFNNKINFLRESMYLPLMEPSINASSEFEVNIVNRFLYYIENDKPYLNDDLSINDVSIALYTNKTYFSKAINNVLNKKFRDVINYYRVREAMYIYISDTNLYTNQLCVKSGFKNIASFTNAFKKNTGYTPGEWCRMVKNNKDNVEENNKINIEELLSR